MSSQLPVYKLHSFARHEPNAPFYMTRLETLVREFKGIDQPHSHTFYLVMCISQGSGTHTIDFKTYPIRPNQLYFLTPGQVHSWQLSTDTQGFNLFFEPGFFQARLGNRLHQYSFYHSHQHVPLLEIQEKQQALFSDLFNYAYQEYTLRQANRADVFLSFVHIILESANRQYDQQLTGADVHYYDRIRQYEALLEAQFIEVRAVSDYAAQMGLTPNHLNHICKKVLGKTASQLLHERLLTEARRLLTHTAQSVKEVGFDLGFDDPSYFVRFFRKQAGQTPVEFRKELAHDH
ncbi:helix-turn-helix domain-containing protein [Fibrella forsythiae]|uniref:Helix-turn-helix domain-containing protein n=1 Tax=Fibrella forsythiae TaxID=2817061 RepID=A0ABS3JP74_9BACT|nr:helix-turn-helix domain-containing protein [Fibrella forsythiae]MBO0951803.1 helix-turn-helix domain-containing protein [Fibrella forsythiae]